LVRQSSVVGLELQQYQGNAKAEREPWQAAEKVRWHSKDESGG
jgi:hypothetical protein